MLRKTLSALTLPFLALAWLLTAGTPALAQQTAKVVSACGTASYTAGTVNYQTVDTAGNQCGASGGAPSGTQDVNIKNINGAAPSLTNPIWIANAEAADSSGTFTNATQTTSVTNTNADGYATALLSINGTYGTATGVFEESDDGGVTYYSIICTRSDGTATETGYTSLTNTNRQWSCPVAGNDAVRVRSTAVASGTVNVRVGISAPTNNSGVVSGQVTSIPATATPIVGVAVAVATGGTAVTPVAANANGCVITNPLTTTDQGIGTVEPLYVNPVTTATTTGNTSTFPLAPGQSFNCVPRSTVAVSVNAATTAHKFTVISW